MYPNHQFSRLAAALIAVALGLLAIACGSGGSVAAPTKVGAVATAVPVTDRPTAEADQPTATSAPASPQTYAIGDIIAIQDVTLVVLGWERPECDQFSKPKPGQSFIAVDLLLVNTGEASEALSSLVQVSLKDGTDLKYTPELLASTAAGASATDGEIVPGERMRGKVGFELPQEAKDLVFVFDADLVGAGKIFVALP
jgi:uncharacterized protein DUF4352